MTLALCIGDCGFPGAALQSSFDAIVGPMFLLPESTVSNGFAPLRFLRAILQARISLRQNGILSEDRERLNERPQDQTTDEPCCDHSFLLFSLLYKPAFQNLAGCESAYVCSSHPGISHDSGHGSLFDCASPGAGFLTPRFYISFESLKISLDSLSNDAKGISGILDETFGVILQLQHDLGLRIRQAMKGNNAPVPRTFSARPGNTLVGNLLCDLGIPFFFFAPDFGFPMQMLVINLFYLLHTFHKTWELFKLSPLVVG